MSETEATPIVVRLRCGGSRLPEILSIKITKYIKKWKTILINEQDVLMEGNLNSLLKDLRGENENYINK